MSQISEKFEVFVRFAHDVIGHGIYYDIWYIEIFYDFSSRQWLSPEITKRSSSESK